MKKQFFLFGDTASRNYYKGGVDEVLADESFPCGIFAWDETTTPNELLSEFNGWGDYVEITEDDYNKLLENGK